MSMRVFVAVGTTFVLGLIASRADAQNIDLKPSFGSVKLDSGFTPDPYAKALIAGGNIRTQVGGVKAYVADPPDYQLFYNAGDKYALTIFAVSDSDTTLLINQPNGKFVANDDAGGKFKLNPALHFANPMSGRYDIWVGTFGPKAAKAKLYITERIAKNSPNVAKVDPNPNPKSESKPKVNGIPTIIPSGKVYRSAEQLFADMPSSAFPKSGSEGGIERAATRKWLNQTFTPSGRTFEFQAKVTKVSVGGDDPFTVTLNLDCKHFRDNSNGDLWSISRPFTLGDQKCKLMLQTVSGLIPQEVLESQQPIKRDGWVFGPTLLRILYNHCTAEEARMFRSFKGKEVTIRAAIQKTSLMWKIQDAVGFGDTSHVIFTVKCRPITINGFLPAALRSPIIRGREREPLRRD